MTTVFSVGSDLHNVPTVTESDDPVGGVVQYFASAAITSIDTSIPVVDATGLPTAWFVIQMATEEILIQSRSGNTLTVATSGRGYGGTTAINHTNGTMIQEALSPTTVEGIRDAVITVSNDISKILVGTFDFSQISIVGTGFGETLRIQAWASSSENLIEGYNNTNTLSYTLTHDGHVQANRGTFNPPTDLVALTAEALDSSGTADLIRGLDRSDATVFSVAEDGQVVADRALFNPDTDVVALVVEALDSSGTANLINGLDRSDATVFQVTETGRVIADRGLFNPDTDVVALIAEALDTTGTANLIEGHDRSDTTVFSVAEDGQITADRALLNPDTDVVGLTVEALDSSGTADLIVGLDNADVEVFNVEESGLVRCTELRDTPASSGLTIQADTGALTLQTLTAVSIGATTDFNAVAGGQVVFGATTGQIQFLPGAGFVTLGGILVFSAGFALTSAGLFTMLCTAGISFSTGVGTSTFSNGITITAANLDVAAGTIETQFRSLSAAATLLSTDSVVDADANSAAFTLTLPTIASSIGQHMWITKINSNSNNVTVDGNGSETIDGATTQVITTQYDTLHLYNNGTEWRIL